MIEHEDYKRYLKLSHRMFPQERQDDKRRLFVQLAIADSYLLMFDIEQAQEIIRDILFELKGESINELHNLSEL
jgi:hypothetical protein